MCLAIEEIKLESRQMGRQEGMQKGMQKGMQEGMQRGMQKGESDTILRNLNSIIRNLAMTPEQAMDALSIPQRDRARYAEWVER